MWRSGGLPLGKNGRDGSAREGPGEDPIDEVGESLSSLHEDALGQGAHDSEEQAGQDGHGETIKKGVVARLLNEEHHRDGSQDDNQELLDHGA